MTEEQATLQAIRGAIAELPQLDQAVVAEAVERLRNLLAAYPGGHASMALALIGAELAAQSEQ